MLINYTFVGIIGLLKLITKGGYVMFFKDLSKKEKKHLKEVAGIHSFSQFKLTAELMKEDRKTSKFEPCYECKAIAIKLGLPV